MFATGTSYTDPNDRNKSRDYFLDTLTDPGIINSLGFGAGSIATDIGGHLILCPWHARRSGTPSCHVFRGNKGRLLVHCHGECEKTRNVLDLIAASYKLETRGSDWRLVLDEARRLDGRYASLEELEEGLGVVRPVRRSAPRTANTATPAPRPALAESGPGVSAASILSAEELATAREERRAAAVDSLHSLIPLLEEPSERGRDNSRSVFSWLQYDRGLGALAKDVGRRRLGWVLPHLPRDSRPEAMMGWWPAHRLYVTLMHDATGEVVSARARTIQEAVTPKSLPPTGSKSAGAVFACRLGRALLRRGPGIWAGPPPLVLICEGEMDFAAVAVCVPENVVVFGVASGSWSEAIAARIPDGSRVAILTHSDAKGVRYLDKVALSLAGRCQLWARNPDPVWKRHADGSIVLDVKGQKVSVKVDDENDLLMRWGANYDPTDLSKLVELEVA